ncbi:hypothetical protein Acr_00g0005610 [Actinidia rufa]|uniref:Uncharacterized protein n=1 Tax=Actinidia rufa TaxID=165716 RepID=A0A7J0D7V4_9ERIC|nr:hypothetical protein Acr_00g0005610 [Actinidia rufa]
MPVLDIVSTELRRTSSPTLLRSGSPAGGSCLGGSSNPATTSPSKALPTASTCHPPHTGHATPKTHHKFRTPFPLNPTELQLHHPHQRIRMVKLTFLATALVALLAIGSVSAHRTTITTTVVEEENPGQQQCREQIQRQQNLRHCQMYLAQGREYYEVAMVTDPKPSAATASPRMLPAAAED